MKRGFYILVLICILFLQTPGFADIFDMNSENSENIVKNSEINSDEVKKKLAKIYILQDEQLRALELLQSVECQDEEVKTIKSQIYYDINMPTSAKKEISGIKTDLANDLKTKIKRESAITFTPTYSFLNQQLAEEYDLDYNKFGIRVSKNIEGNKELFAEYNEYLYSTGGTVYRSMITEFLGGISSRPIPKFEYNTNIGVKIAQFGHGNMIITDSYLKYYTNDNANFKLGFYRNNLIQTYLSAVGKVIDGNYVGRVSNNRLYLDFNTKLPYKLYGFGRGTFGIMTGQNLPTNLYTEGMLGVGKVLYKNDKNNWLQKADFNVNTFNTAYQYNLLNIYSKNGSEYGGYFSPSYYNATVGQLKLDGNIKKWHLKYSLSGFAGVQTAMSQDFTRLTWGVIPSVSYEVNNNISLNFMYDFYKYASVCRHLFEFYATIRL